MAETPEKTQFGCIHATVITDGQLGNFYGQVSQTYLLEFCCHVADEIAPLDLCKRRQGLAYNFLNLPVRPDFDDLRHGRGPYAARIATCETANDA